VNLAKLVKNPKAASLADLLTVEVLGFPSLIKGAKSCGVFPGSNGEVLFSEAVCAIELKPNTILISLGANDVLQTIIDGIPPTSLEKFSDEYALLLGGLSLKTGAQLVVSNIPDVTESPFLFPYAAFEAVCGFAPLGAGPSDYLVPNIANPTALNFNICTNYAVRSGSLIASVRRAVRQYNVIVGLTAAQYGAVVVDVNAVLGGIAKNGYNAGKHHLTTQYLGGIFSLDAVHPTNTGYAILANAFIERMNIKLGTKIPTVNVAEVADTDPLVFH
jgi:lysophospholipase L1-like esterase